ncbi:ArnT family glycosyltransferase [Cellulomonas taurus]|uniref:ArnT family glycosyltransferase n=1 Tax=Cellulomonas taurus TaxID=2729175 RepID=UPI00145D6E0E|nr:glycosyltransferase family 39 protein [Cellulomonas taurus]
MTTPGGRVARVLVAVPDRAPVLLLALGLAGLLTVLAGVFTPWTVLPLAGMLGAGLWRWSPTAPPVTRAGLWSTVAVLLGCVAWVGWSARHLAEYVVVNRDPGFLTLQALWLVDHPAAPIPVGAAATAAVSGAGAGTEAFFLQDGALHAQGNKMLPALLAMPGWVAGESGVRLGGLLIGVVALLAVFGTARRLAGPVVALVPTAALACCLPFLVSTRAAYTEPLTVAFLAGGLTVALAGWRDQGWRPAVLTGLLIGGIATARIDGAVAVVGLVGGVAVAGVAAGGAARGRAVLAVLAATAMTALGLVDVLRLSPEYLRMHQDQVSSLLTATAVVVVVGVLVLAVPAARLGSVRRWVLIRRRTLGGVAAAVVLLLAVVLASRPLWWQGRWTDADSGFGIAVQILQAADGQPLDPARSYDEQTVTWVVWYLGIAAVVLGFLGLALLLRRAVVDRDPGLLVVVAVIGVAAVFPLVRVSITPDQVWAARRLLPATFPGLLLGATAALDLLVRTPGRVARPIRRALAAGLALALVAVPVSTWRPGAYVSELSGRSTQAHAVCAQLSAHGVDRVVWTHSSPFRYLATLRVLCDVEVVEFVGAPDRGQLAAVLAAWGGGRVAVASFDPAVYTWTSEPIHPVGATTSTTLGRSLSGVPDTVDSVRSQVWLGTLRPDGTVTPF